MTTHSIAATGPASHSAGAIAGAARSLPRGVMPVVIMPYDHNGDVHEHDFTRQVHHMLHVGCDGVVVGQVSEVSRLTARERFRVAELLAEACGSAGCAVMSTGGESIRMACEYSRQAEAAGCDALLVMHPAMAGLDDEEMFRYFAAVAESVSVPILVHHAKSLAKRPLSIAVQARLLEAYGAEKVQFKPEAQPSPPRLSELRDATSGRARIFEGDGGMMLADTFRRGLAGVIPATEIAEITVAIWRLLESGQEERARPIAYQLSYLMCHMMNSIDCYLGIAKHLLHRRNLIGTTLIRPPLDFHVDTETLAEIEHVYDDLLTRSRAAFTSGEAA